MSFGKRLKLARSAKKLTQVEVANKLGIDDTTISKYENDKSEPDNETLVRLLDLYGVNFDYIHGRKLKETIIEETDVDKMFLEEYLSYDDKKKEKFRKIMSIVREE